MTVSFQSDVPFAFAFSRCENTLRNLGKSKRILDGVFLTGIAQNKYIRVKEFELSLGDSGPSTKIIFLGSRLLTLNTESCEAPILMS